MIAVLEWLTGSTVATIVTVLGIPGLSLLFFYDSVRRMQSSIEAEQALTRQILSQYREDVRRVSQYYDNNVELVKRYADLADSLSEIIHLNTQVQTQLVEAIKNNMFCPMIREKGPQR